MTERRKRERRALPKKKSRRIKSQPRKTK